MSIAKAIYPIEIVLTGSAETGTYDLPASVNRANSLLFFNGAFCDVSGQWFQNAADLDWVDDDTVILSRDTSNTPDTTLTGRGLVIEFIDGVIESKEERNLSLGTNNATHNLNSAVTFARSFAIFRGHRYNVSSNGDAGGLVGVALISGTQFTTFTAGTGAANSMKVTIAQIAAEYVESIQNFAEVLSSSTTVDNIPISPVDVANTFLFYNGMMTNSGGQWRESATRIALQATDNVRTTRGNNATVNRTMCFALWELPAGIIASAQNGTVTITNTQNANATINEVDEDLTAVFYHGMSTDQANANGTINLAAVKLNSPTQIRGDKGSALNGVNHNAAFRAMEFEPPAPAPDPSPDPGPGPSPSPDPDDCPICWQESKSIDFIH